MKEIPDEQVLAQLEKIFTSPQFVASHKLTHFLRLIVQESLAGACRG